MVESSVELLLVEDSPDDGELVLRAFDKMRLTNTVHWVRDGAEALEFCFAEGRYAGRDPHDGPKIVLLDLKLPRVGGLEVLRRLRGDPRTRLLPVVVLTSSQQEQDLVESYQLGVNSYIVKPVDFEQFASAVGNLGLYWLLLNQPPPS